MVTADTADAEGADFETGDIPIPLAWFKPLTFDYIALADSTAGASDEWFLTSPSSEASRS